MNNIILATNVDTKYFREKNDDWVRSCLKNKTTEMKVSIFYMKKDDFKISYPNDNVQIVDINIHDLKHSIQKYAIGKRSNYVCVETGEFLEYTNYNDEDILILCDYDVTMQREISKKEIEILNSLDNYQFACNLDDYSKKEGSLKSFYDRNSKNGIFAFGDDVNNSWVQYNAGVQAGRISAWKNLFESWKQVSDTFMKNVPHHFYFQMYFSSFLNRHKLVVEMPETFHNAHWFTGTKASVKKNDCLFVGDEKVLFFHHKFQKRPQY